MANKTIKQIANEVTSPQEADWLEIQQDSSSASGKVTVTNLTSAIATLGESNTSSNSGVATYGLAQTKSGVDLPFKSLTATSSKIGLTANTNDVGIDVVPTNIKLDDLGTPDNNTDLDASTSRHGLLPKLSGNSAQFLNGNGAFSGVTTSAFHVDTTPVTISNTSAETTLYQVSIPTNTLAAGSVLRFSFMTLEAEAASSSITYRVKYGSTKIGEISKSMVDGTGELVKGQLAVNSAGNQQGIIEPNTYSSTEDETTTLNLTITAQMGVADVGNTITGNSLTIEVLV